MMKRAVWINGKRKLTGSWEWFDHSQRFVIELDRRDRDTGQKKRIVTAGSHRGKPEWGKWELSNEVSA